MKKHDYAWPLAFTVVALAMVAAAVFVFVSLRDVPGDVLDTGRDVARELVELARTFNSGSAQVAFASYATRVTGGNRLQFAELEQMEIFERTDQAATMWGQLPLPDVVVEARAPVTYTYYLDLEKEWQMSLRGNEVVVYAPPIEFNTPAIDASRISYTVRADSLLRDEDEALIKLKKGLTSMSKMRAAEHVVLIREVGRQKTAEFVEGWLLEHLERPATDLRLRVVFPDERIAEPAGPAGD